jgi:hypothetical protein
MTRITAAILLACFAITAAAQERTVINDAAAAKRLLGRHMLSLQWISWDHFGTATVTNTGGVYRIKGQQKGRGQSATDHLLVEGVIRSIDKREFVMEGRVVMRVSHINSGEPCVREGLLTFRVTGSRKYWRMQEMDNPCDEATDYVDIYFK